MNRRDFLTRMLGAAAATAVMAELAAVDATEWVREDVRPAEWLPTLDAVHKAAYREFVAAFGPAMVSQGPPLRIGDSRDGYVFQHVLGIDTSDFDRFVCVGGVKGAMEALAEGCRLHSVRVFAPMNLPKHCDAKNAGDMLRMARAWDAVQTHMFLRFDVLGASA